MLIKPNFIVLPLKLNPVVEEVQSGTTTNTVIIWGFFFNIKYFYKFFYGVLLILGSTYINRLPNYKP